MIELSIISVLSIIVVVGITSSYYLSNKQIKDIRKNYRDIDYFKKDR